MPVVHIETDVQLSTEELLQAVGQLSPADFDQFMARVLALHTERRPAPLPQAEATLLEKINERMPPDTWKHYDELVAKRRAATLTAAEHETLLRLDDQIEEWHLERMKCLLELARLRGTSLDTIMKDLGIRPRSNG